MQTVSALSNPFTAATLLLLLFSAPVSLTTFSVNTEPPSSLSLHHFAEHRLLFFCFLISHFSFQKSPGAFVFSENI